MKTTGVNTQTLYNRAMFWEIIQKEEFQEKKKNQPMEESGLKMKRNDTPIE